MTMPAETVGEVIHLQTCPHPARTDSPEYRESRKWLMGVVAGGCFVCGGVPDMTHPEDPQAAGMEDHHGGGLYLQANGTLALVGFNLGGLEWSLGFSANPAKVQALRLLCDALSRELDQAHVYDGPDIVDTATVMAWVDSQHNANVKICAVHHRATETAHSPDVNGHEAVGVHEAPFPIWLAQATNDWNRWDLFGGTTGTVAVAPHTDEHGNVVAGHARVLRVSANHPDPALRAEHAAAHAAGVPHVLPAHHPVARLANAGAHVDLAAP